MVIPVTKEPANNAPMNAHGLVIVATANIPDAGIRLSAPQNMLNPPPTVPPTPVAMTLRAKSFNTIGKHPSVI